MLLNPSSPLPSKLSVNRRVSPAVLATAGAMSDALLLNVFSLLFAQLYTTAYHFPPALIGLVIGIPRICDALSDPIIGHYSDTLRSRWGRRKPLMAVGLIGSAVSVMALWWAQPSWPIGWQFTYLLIVGFIYWVSYSLFSVPYNAFLMEFTNDYNGRTKIATLRSIFGIATIVPAGWLYWLVLRPAFGNEINGVRIVSIGIAIVVLLTGLIPLWFVPESAHPKTTHQTNFLQGVRDAARNRPFVYLLAIRALLTFGNYLGSTLTFYINVFYVCRGDKDLASTIAAISLSAYTLVASLSMPLCYLLSRRFGKNTVVAAGIGMALAGALAAPLVYTNHQPWLQLAYALFTAPCAVLVGIGINAMLPDVCDVDELRHGSRREGLFSAISTTFIKLEVSLASIVVAWLLVWVGFDSNLPQQTDRTLFLLRLIGFGTVGLCALLSLLIAQFNPLNKPSVLAIQAELAARRSS